MINLENPRVVKTLVIALVLFSVASYGNLANNFSQGRVFLPLDLVTLLAKSVSAGFFAIFGFKLVAQSGSSVSAVILFGIVTTFILPMSFASAYLVLQQHSVCLTNEPSAYDIAYFSFVNFTTLGFGDFAPLRFCKALSALEAVLGYIFLGVFSALLIANLLSERN